MKKTLLLGGALFAAAVAAVLTTNPVSAADTPAAEPNDSTAMFTITDNGQKYGKSLYLTAVPNFTFGSQNLTDLMKQDVSFGTSTGAYAGNQLGVADYTQSDKGWNVTAKVGDFKGANTSLTASSLAFTTGNVAGDNVGATDSGVSGATTDIVKTGNAVLTAKPGYGEGQTTAQVSAPSLTIAKNVKAKADTYTGHITWTVNSGKPAPTPAN